MARKATGTFDGETRDRIGAQARVIDARRLSFWFETS